MSDSFVERYLREITEIANRLDRGAISAAIERLAAVRERGGRLFLLGVGGSAANASHAVNDFRKLCGFEAYTPTDNVAELTARINDEGWAGALAAWLRVSRIGPRDGVLVFSVGGGSEENNVSPNLVEAIREAKRVGATVIGIVGRDGGYTARVADACVVIPVVNPDAITPYTEAFQAVVAHLMVSHPRLKSAPTRWEQLEQSGPQLRGGVGS